MTSEEVAVKLENHEQRITQLEKLDEVVDKLAETVNTVNTTANTNREAMEIMAKTVQELQQNQHDKDLIKEHSFSNHIWSKVKSLSLFDILKIVGAIAACIVAINAYLVK